MKNSIRIIMIVCISPGNNYLLGLGQLFLVAQLLIAVLLLSYFTVLRLASWYCFAICIRRWLTCVPFLLTRLQKFLMPPERLDQYGGLNADGHIRCSANHSPIPLSTYALTVATGTVSYIDPSPLNSARGDSQSRPQGQVCTPLNCRLAHYNSTQTRTIFTTILIRGVVRPISRQRPYIPYCGVLSLFIHPPHPHNCGVLARGPSTGIQDTSTLRVQNYNHTS
jgi:hypothetical protein